ncbi:hypothetical protein ES703_76455 [subsurface metagenome]
MELKKVIRRNGKIATLTLATRKTFTCAECVLPIPRHTHYYSVVLGGSGLGSTKFPDRAHIECVNKSLKRGANERTAE